MIEIWLNSFLLTLKTIDVGGGISPEERNFSFKDYYDMLISYFDKERFNFIFEPGRLIAGIKVENISELVEKLKNEAGVI